MKKVVLATVREWTKRAVIAHIGHDVKVEAQIWERSMGRYCQTCDTLFTIAIEDFKKTGDLPALRYLQDEMAPAAVESDEAEDSTAKKKKKRKAPKPDYITESLPVVTFVQEEITVEVKPNTNLRQVALANGVQLYRGFYTKLNCHGRAKCTSCRIQLSNSDAVNTPNEIEKAKKTT